MFVARSGKAARVAALGAVLASSAWIAGCGGSATDGFDSDSVIGPSCPVAVDQRASFMAKDPSFPLHIRADDTFSFAERSSLGAAVQRWNALARQWGYPAFFEVQYVPISPALRASDPRDCDTGVYGTADTFSIVRETLAERWVRLGFSDTIPAATLRCYRNRWVDHQVILLYLSVVDPLQVTSVLLHELGHALGLDHSCVTAKGRERFVGCSALAEDHPYHQAVMYPSLRAKRSALELPETKEDLMPNDELRSSCLYGR